MNKFILMPFIALSILISHVSAADLSGKSRNQDALRSALWEFEKDATRVQSATATGKNLTEFCVICHGENGISKHDWEPNLAGQNSTYLLDQLINFASGKRKNLVMNDLASKFNDENLIDIAIYYSTMTNTYIPAKVNAEKILEGKKIYQNTCMNCHGVNGKGNVGFAALSGQKTKYLINNLRKFKGSSRRSSDVMGPIVAKLSDQDIEAVAHYITSMSITQ